MNPSDELLGPRTGRRNPGQSLAPLASDLLPPLDIVCLLVAAALSTVLYTYVTIAPALSTTQFAHAPWVAAVLSPFILYDKDFGSLAIRGAMQDWIRPFTLRFCVFASVVLILAVLTRTLDHFPFGWLVLWFASSLLLTLLSRSLMAKAIRTLQRRGAITEAIAVVGAGPLADRLVQALRQNRPDSVDIIGIFDDRFARTDPDCSRPVGNLTQLIELGKSRKIDWILIALPPTAEQRLLGIMQRLMALSVPIGLCPQHIGSTLPYRVVDYTGNGVPISLLADRPIKRWDALTKSAEDLVLGVSLTVLLLPVFAIVALAIKLDSPGPVIFRQRRHAVNNREFEIFKFRTMQWMPSTNALLQQTARNDARVTRVGRILRATSLDELPQLLNVLLGQMSLVGPRPHAVDMRTEDRLGAEVTARYEHRHRVKPGMTGWSQVNGARGPTDTQAQLQRRVELDLHYIENWSLSLDIKILVLTVREVIRQTNAY